MTITPRLDGRLRKAEQRKEGNRKLQFIMLDYRKPHERESVQKFIDIYPQLSVSLETPLAPAVVRPSASSVTSGEATAFRHLKVPWSVVRCRVVMPGTSSRGTYSIRELAFAEAPSLF